MADGNSNPVVNQKALDDYMELEAAHEAPTSDISNDLESFESKFPEKINFKTLRRQISASRVNRSAIMPFLASVNLDMERRTPVDVKELFMVWLEKGNKHWLNPLDKHNGLGVLEEILFKFNGDIQVLRPFISLLTEIAQAGISPRSFVEYVILPRIREDNNWRKWQEKHLEAVKIIANLISEIKDQPPFNREHLGSGKTRLARDIVLVRYIGRPLAQFQITQLRDKDMLDNYREAWRKISLNDPLSLFFMRNNALHFLYSMSGKIDLVQLIAIVEQLPEIEQAFTGAFPDGNIKMEKIKAINLYDYDIDQDLIVRKQRGFHSLDYANEIKSYFNIVKALLEKATGVYLCAYYAGLLKRYKDPVIAEQISSLVHILDDRGGLYIYKWHTKKLLTYSAVKMKTYIDFVEDNRGCDPDYPKVHLLFRDEIIFRETEEILDLAHDFGLGNVFIGKEQQRLSYKDLLTAYVKKYPDTGELIENYQKQLLTGEDRSWTDDYARQLDDLSGGDRDLYGPLLRSVIRGIGNGWEYFHKSSGFSELYSKYNAVKSFLKINAKTEFQMPIRPVGRSSADRDNIARKQANLAPVEKVWQSLNAADTAGVNAAIAFINKWSMDLPLENIFREKVVFEEALKEADNEQEKAKLEKNIAKQDKTIEALQKKKENFSAIMDKYDSLDDEQKFIVILILAGTVGKSDDAFTAYSSALFLRRYSDMEGIRARLSFLQEDISVDVLTYQQFGYLLNLLETLFLILREDEKISALLAKDDILQEILEPYLITKKKQVTMDALDAAVKKMTEYANLQAERAKWQGVLSELEEKSEKYFHKMEIYTSKTFIDSHYGDMGGICLSAQPQQILHPGFYVQRLADYTDGQIIGMSILFLSGKGFSASGIQAQNYWHAFAFNPLASVLSHYSAEQQLHLYLHYRLNMEKIAWITKLPIVLSGVETGWGLISNNGSFGDLICNYELSKKTAKRVYNAKGLALYYSENEYAKALVIIDPRGYEDPSQVPTFYASRELENIKW